jgi:hypothetical protein
MNLLPSSCANHAGANLQVAAWSLLLRVVRGAALRRRKLTLFLGSEYGTRIDGRMVRNVFRVTKIKGNTSDRRANACLSDGSDWCEEKKGIDYCNTNKHLENEQISTLTKV